MMDDHDMRVALHHLDNLAHGSSHALASDVIDVLTGAFREYVPSFQEPIGPEVADLQASIAHMLHTQMRLAIYDVFATIQQTIERSAGS